MREDDRAGTCFVQDAMRNNARSRTLPIERIYIPNDDAVTKVVVDPIFCRAVIEP